MVRNDPISRTFITLLSCLVMLASGTAGWGQPEVDKPKILVPARKPTREQQERAEALKLYAKAAVLEHDNQLIEALKNYEEALRLDPDAAPILRGLIPLYLAVDRSEDAFAACVRVLKLDPDDFATGYLYARQLRLHERPMEALNVLTQLSQRPGLKAFPDLRVRMSYDRGQLYEDRKEWKAAIAAYRDAAAVLDEPAELLDADHCTAEEVLQQAAETYERLGRIYLKQDETKAARNAFAEARKRDPSRSPRLAYVLAEILSEKGEWADVLVQVNEYLGSQPQGLEGYELKIKALRKLDRTEQILPDLEQASKRDHYNLGLKLMLAREYRQAGKKEAAERICLDLAHDRPTSEVYRELLTLYQQEGTQGAAKALDMLNLAMDKGARHDDKPGDASEGARARAMLAALREDGALAQLILSAIPQRLQKGPALALSTRMMFASLALRLRQLDLAEQLFRSGLGKSDRPESEVYGGLLRVLSLGHKNDAVIELCQRGLKEGEKSNRVMFHLEMSQALLNLDRVNEAVAEADAAVKEAGEAEALLSRRNRAYLLSQAGKVKEAIAECQALLKDYNQPGEQRDIHSTLAIVYLNAGEYAESEKHLQLILDTDPSDATICNDLGYQWADRNKNLPEAEKLVRKAIELDRKQRREGNWIGLDVDLDNPAYLDSLGWVLFRKGQLKEARQELERASKLPGGADDPVVWGHLGDVRKEMGEDEQARAAWEKALGLYDNHQRRPDANYRELKHKLRKAEQ